MDGAGDDEEMVVLQLEDAVKLLMEHLVEPVLPRGARQDERNLAPEKQQIVAQQMHTAVILYNYYHRKLSPQLVFADAKRFCTCSCLAAGEDLLAYLNMVHEHDSSSGEDAILSVTDRAVMDACEIAEALDASKDSPDMTSWPVSKVAVLLLNPTRNQCLIQDSSTTKGVWSIIEKEFDEAAGNSHSSNQPIGQESTNKVTPCALHEQRMLMQLPFSEVEHRTGLKRSNLRLLDERLTYSLSKKRTTTKLFVVEYEQIVKRSNLMEIPLQELIKRATGPVFMIDPFPETTCVVAYYHILPYKEIMFECMHRKWPSDSTLNEQSRRHEKCSQHSEIDENLEELEAISDSKSKMQKPTTEVTTAKQKKQAIEATGTNSNNNRSTSKDRKNSNTNTKRKSAALRATSAEYAEGRGSDGLAKEIESPIVGDVETSKLASRSINAKGTAPTTVGNIFVQAGVQIDKNRTQKQSFSGNIPQDVFSTTTKVPCIDHAVKNDALEGQNVQVSEKSGGITKKNDQMCISLQSLQKIRDDIHRKQCILEERGAQCDMDIQTILSEGKMTPKVMSIVDKYKDTNSNMMKVANSSCSGEGGQTISMKRKRLIEATLLRNECQELDEICRESNWILPRYTVLPSVPVGMFQASVRLTGLDLNLSADGDLHMTPHEARCSAAASMIFELHKKAEKLRAEQQNNVKRGAL